MTTELMPESPNLTAWLTELAQVFQERDDFRDEVERLQAQYAEVSEVAFARGQRQREDAETIAEKNQTIQDLVRVDETKTRIIHELNEQLLVAKRVFGDAFVHGPTGPTRKNRAKLTPAQVGGIRSMVAGGSTRKAVAAVYGVHPTTVSRIADGTYHKESA